MSLHRERCLPGEVKLPSFLCISRICSRMSRGESEMLLRDDDAIDIVKDTESWRIEVSNRKTPKVQ